jgi:hypothetical protein
MTHDGQYIFATDGAGLVVKEGDKDALEIENQRYGILAAALCPIEPLAAWASEKILSIEQEIDWRRATPSEANHKTTGEVLCLAFSRDGKRLAIGTSDSKIQILDVAKLIAK